jgi:hypothetical protein
MWVSASVGGDVIYTWDQTKEAIVAERIAPEWYRGVLQPTAATDWAAFCAVAKDAPVHRRRSSVRAAGARAAEVFDAAKAGCPLNARLLKIINVLTASREARENGCTPEQRAALR